MPQYSQPAHPNTATPAEHVTPQLALLLHARLRAHFLLNSSLRPIVHLRWRRLHQLATQKTRGDHSDKLAMRV